MARFNFILPERELQDLEKMADEMGVTVTRLVRTLGRLGNTLYNESKMGGELIVRRSDGTEVKILWGVSF